MKRVVSLVPSITETLLEWGVPPVGVTRFCEAPGIPTVGGTKNPDVAAILALEPDVVLMDKEENRKGDAASLTQAGVRVGVTDVRSVADVATALAVVAAEVGLSSAPAAVAPPVSPPGVLRRLRVFVPIWRRPWMTVNASTYGSSLLHSAGLDNVFASEPDPYPTVELTEAVSRRPDFVLAPSEPYAFKEKHRAELEQVAPVVFVDGQDLFWWGARTPAARQRIGEMARVLAGA